MRRYNLDNLREYWQPLAATLLSRLTSLAPDAVVGGEAVSWYVLGPARLHYTLAHDDIISKAAAGDYLAQMFSEYADVARRATRWRAGEAEQFTPADLVAACDSVNAVSDDAWRRFGS